MTTTDLAVIEPEVLTKAEAKKLDGQIRRKSDAAVAARDKTIGLLDELTELLTRAREGQIHKALGLKSWTAYVADAVALPQALEREDRKVLVQFLSGQGMSQRAIAGSLNVSQKTVDRDLDGEETEEGATVTSLDGAQRPKNGKAKDEEPLDVEYEEVPEVSEPEPEPMKAVDIVSAFGDETANLFAAQNELTLLAAEEKWDGARRRVSKANLQNLKDIAGALDEIINDLSNVDG